MDTQGEIPRSYPRFQGQLGPGNYKESQPGLLSTKKDYNL